MKCKETNFISKYKTFFYWVRGRPVRSYFSGYSDVSSALFTNTIHLNLNNTPHQCSYQ